MNNYVLIFLFILITAGVSAQNASLTRGVYRTFDEFKAGIPTVVDSFYVDSFPRTKQKWLGTYEITPRYVKNNKAIKKIWGFCDGQQSYIFFQSEFFPLDYNGADISFDAYGIYDASGAAVSAMAFGGIGVGIYMVVASSAAKDKRVKYVINPNNGDIYSAKDLEEAFYSFKEKKLVLYRGTKNEINESMSFAINDTVITTFLPGSYLELEIQPPVHQIEICFGKEFDNCETILFTDLIQYVECQYSQKRTNGKYNFVAVNISEGEHHSVWSYDVQDRRERKLKRVEAGSY